MQIEYEATFSNVDANEIRDRLQKSGASLKRPEFIQKRSVFHFPEGNSIQGGWLRVRDEGNKITMSVKVVDGNKIHDQKETCLEVNDFKEAETFLQTIGCKRKAYQETKRELWVIDDVEITIDTWPFLEPFIEIEGLSEEKVKEAAEKIGMDWDKAIFGAVDVLYSRKYGITKNQINNETPEIVFNMENPFIK
ncbi:MAG: CYTH domain protein [Parcubacteria bacterium OLB19]|nr:MAG: CYTH domain protein [Parcubacteria bacterium OLB19]